MASAYTGMTPPEWTLFVQAGMNDIDRRCDTYLTWLDDKRRSREPVLKQLADMGAATAGILQAANVGAAPIAMVGIAFGLAADTFTNVNSRLLFEINQSTVQEIVFRREQQFRAAVVRKAIISRPDAIHALRLYLRICMPITIETEINTGITLLERGGLAAGGAQRSLVAPDTVGRALISNPERPLPPPPPPPPAEPNKLTAVERAMSPEEVKRIQMALCVPSERDLGPPQSRTRLAIRDYLIGRRFSGVTDDIKIDVRIRANLNEAADEVGDCLRSSVGLKNSFEVGAYGVPATLAKDKITDMQRKLKIALTKSGSSLPVPDETGVFDPKTRAAIAEFSKSQGGGVATDQLSRSLDLAIKAVR